MKVSYTVMAHPARMDAAVALAASVGAGLVIDSLGVGETENGDRAWRMFDPTADWHVVLQDDALPVEEFTAHVERALTAARWPIVSLYVGSGRPHQRRVLNRVQWAKAQGASWMEAPTMLWGVGIAMTTATVHEFLVWGDGKDGPYDRRIGRFARAIGSGVGYVLPSLVDHADGPTLVQHPWGPPLVPRRAVWLGTAESYDSAAVYW